MVNGDEDCFKSSSAHLLGFVILCAFQIVHAGRIFSSFFLFFHIIHGVMGFGQPGYVNIHIHHL